MTHLPTFSSMHRSSFSMEFFSHAQKSHLVKEALQKSFTLEDVASAVNESGDEAGKPDKGKVTLTVSEALESLDGVKNKMNMMLNDLIGSVEKLKLKTLRQTNITSFLKK